MAEESDMLKLVRVYATEQEKLERYIEALYEHDDQFESMVNIREGVASLMRNEALSTPYFINRDDDKIGYVILTRYHSVKKGGLTIFIDELFVDPKERRKGVGKGVMTSILEIAREEGARSLWVQTEGFNEGAQAFFKGQGFRQETTLSFERPV